MNKLYGSLIAVIICSIAHELVASEKPFFDKKTQNVLKTATKNYVVDCGSMAVGVFGVALVAEYWMRKNRVSGSLNSVHRNVGKKTAQAIVIGFPIALGSAVAYHKYQEHFHAKNSKTE